MSFWDPFNVLDPGKAWRAGGKEIKKGWEEAKGFEKPYWQSGMDQIGRLTGAQDKLMDPGALQNEWAKGYETSPYAKQLQDQAKAGGMDAASSQGLLGSSSAINAIQQGSSNIMNADRQNYMNDLMEKYKTGLGIGQNMYNTGAAMGGTLGGQAMDFGKQNASMQFGKANAPMDMMMNMLKMYMASQGGGMGGF